MRIAILLCTAMLAFSQSIAGSFRGSWAGANGGGDFHLNVKNASSAEVGFTIEGQEVPGKILSLKIDGSSIDVVYEFNLQGIKMQSAAKGTLKGKSLEGTYKTTAEGSPVDEGTWKTTLQ